MNLAEIQSMLREQKLDGWLFFDHHQRDPLAYRVLKLAPKGPVTRRWYYFIPASGEPRGLVHRIESGVLRPLPGEHRPYSTWSTQVDGLRTILGGAKRVAMQYSPHCAVPYVAMVDAGTVELVRSLGVEVMTSADLIQFFEARWTEGQLASHLEAGRRVDRVRREAFVRIGEKLVAAEAIGEYDVQQFILRRFHEEGLFIDHGPIVGVNGNASDPHYEPSQDRTQPVHKGDVVLIDLWGKLDQPDSVYYDITWCGYCGDVPPSAVVNVFDTVKAARDSAVARVQQAISGGEDLRGFQVDDAARDVIRAKGFGDYFVHRTGHSIGVEVHGAGANMDNLETHDERRVIPWTCFSVEPGIYLPEFGIRSELNVFVEERGARVTGEIQQELVRI